MRCCLLLLVVLELVACRRDEQDAAPIPIPSAPPVASVAPEKPIGVRCYRDGDCAADESCEIIAAGPDMGIRNCTKRAAAPPATTPHAITVPETRSCKSAADCDGFGCCIEPNGSSHCAVESRAGSCAGRFVGANGCATFQDCGAGFYCRAGVCAVRIGDGGTCASGKDVECREGLRCIKDLVLGNRCKRSEGDWTKP